MWTWVFSPSWNWLVKSFSRRIFEMPPVAATLPAVSDDSDVTSSSSTSPASAIGWPSRPMSSTALALASRASRAQTIDICCCSSGNITSGPFIALLA